jgi:hypothetical protein
MIREVFKVGLSEKKKKIEGSIPPVTANKAPPVIAAAPMIPPRFHLAHFLSEDCFPSPFDFSSFAKAMAEQATMTSIASCKEKVSLNKMKK